MAEAEPLRIGIDVSRASRENHGIPIYTRSVLAELGKLDTTDQFVLLSYPDSPVAHGFGLQDPELAAIPYSGRYIPWVRVFQEQVLYPAAQQRLNLDVMWHPQNHGQFWTPVGYVCTLHDVLPYSRPDLAQDLDTRREQALYWSRVQSAAHADMIITVSEFSRKEIIRLLGVDPSRVVAVQNGIDHTTFRVLRSEVDRARLQTQYGLPERYVLTVGSYGPHKDLATMIRAFKTSDLMRLGYNLVMVGPKDEIVYTSDHEGLEEMVRDEGLEGRVLMLPPVPVTDLVGMYNGASMFCITSQFEGFGLTPLEAMACGVPVISSDSSSLPEVCGNAALYAHVGDYLGFAERMNLLATDIELARRMTSLGLMQAAKYDWATTAQKTLDILQRVGRTNRRS